MKLTTTDMGEIRMFCEEHPEIVRKTPTDISKFIRDASKHDTLDRLTGDTVMDRPIRDVLEDIARIIDKSVVFDYGINNQFLKSHGQFTMDMIEKGVYVTPYANCMVKFKHSDGMVEWFCVTRTGSPEPYVIPFAPVFITNGEVGYLPTSILRFDAANTTVSGITLMITPEARAHFENHLSADYLSPLCAISSLMSKGVVVDRHVTSDKVNAKRVSQGKKPYLPRFTVRVQTDATEHRSTGSPQTRRASPEVHWRRGHFRKLSEDQIIPVTECMVGANHMEVSDVGKKMYEVVKDRVRSLGG